MLQVKFWSFDVVLPSKWNAKTIEKEVNEFLKTHNCLEDSFEVFEMSNGVMFCKVLYKVRKKK